MSTTNQKTTALYCRLSKEDMRAHLSQFADESISIENQKLILQKFADRNGLRNTKFYVDDGYTGSTVDRPAYQQIIEDVKNGQISTVIVKDLSRLGRDYLQAGIMMEILLPQYDVRFIAINDNEDSVNGISDYAGIKNFFNDFYARDTSKKIRAVLRAKGERGERAGAAVPYGYMKDPENPKQIVPDPESALIVKRIFEESLSGLGVRKICDRLAADKILAPGVYAFQKSGNRKGNPNLDLPYHWDHKTVREMLANRTYCGDTVNFKTYSKSNKLKKRIKNAPENTMLFLDTHEAIVERKTFELVQKRFEGRKRPGKSGMVDKYAGLLYCGECGSRLYIQRSADKNKFMCSGYQSRLTDCTAHYIREDDLDEIVLRGIRAMTAFAREHPDEFYETATEKGRAESEKLKKSAEQERKQIESRVAQIDKTIRCLYEDRVVGRITPERYDQLASGYETEQEKLKSRLSELEKQIAEVDLQDKYIRDFIEQSKRYVEMPELTPELLQTFIRRIEVYEKPRKYSRTCGNPIKIYYKSKVGNALEATTIRESA